MNNLEKDTLQFRSFSLAWKVPLSKEKKEEICRYFDSIDYTKFNKILLELLGAEDMTLNEATDVMSFCKKEDIYCSLSVVIDNKCKSGSRILSVKCTYEQEILKGSFIKLIKEDKVVELGNRIAIKPCKWVLDKI